MNTTEYERLYEMTRFERESRGRGYCRIAGVDEAGRGALAGPVVSAAVILPFDYYPEGLNDSKLLSPKKREELYGILTKDAVAWSFGLSENTEIDEINILNATKLSMERAIKNLTLVIPDFLLIDAVSLRADQFPSQKSIIKGDALSLSIAAASVIAKVTRDRMMKDYDDIYPAYGFSKHKGYGTKAHMESIRQYGRCPIHRVTFKTK